MVSGLVSCFYLLNNLSRESRLVTSPGVDAVKTRARLLHLTDTARESHNSC